MKLNDYFIANKKESVDSIFKIYSTLNEKIKKYVKNNKPILDGEIDYYNKIIADKHLPKNPQEIETVLENFSEMFKRAVIWENPGTMINITPPANIVSIATAFYTSNFNPNFAQDESSGYLMATELLTAKYLAELVNWDILKAKGIFTFGGKGTNLYAVKIGIKKVLPNVIEEGIKNKDIVVISSEKGHPCHLEVCDWLGLGKNSCIRLPVMQNGQIDIKQLELTMIDAIKQNKIIACIILNGGTTNELIVDPIKEVVELRNKIVKEYKLNYIPHIHVDSVIGWAWMFFKQYDYKLNLLNMNKIELKKIKSLSDKISEVTYADSFGADFHKTGFCPYISSIFMVKNANDITSLGNKQSKEVDKMKFGEYSPFEYTLELTRSSIGPVSAYISLETFGVTGFQNLIYNIFSNSEHIRNKINSFQDFEVINMDTEGIATLFVITPPNSKLKYNDYLNLDKNELDKFLNYNNQFYLYCLKMLEDGKIHFKITYSKSYKPYKALYPTGALKIYPTSPITKKEEIDKCLIELKKIKNEFDNKNITLYEERDIPIDYVYRD